METQQPAAQPVTPQPVTPQRIVITGIDVPFVDWITLLIKLVVASIPATMIVSLFMFAVFIGFTMLAGVSNVLMK